MKRIALAALVLLALAGCAVRETTEDSTLSTSTVTVNGRTLVCVIYSGLNYGGVSCDWEGYHSNGGTP